MQMRSLLQTLALVATLSVVASGAAQAQWFPYPGTVIGGIFQDHRVATLRTRVTPRDAQVFVDGYSAGPVDDFDGVFQRLQLIPGQHEITIYLSGYRTYRERLYLNPGASHDIRHTLAPLAAGEPEEPAPLPRVVLPPGLAGGPGGIAPPVTRSDRYGMLALRVQPADARILVDGEEWRSSPPQDRLSLQLGEGRHHLQIQKPGFQDFSGDVDVRAGETSALNVSLLAQ